LADLRTKNRTIFLPICFFNPKIAAGEKNHFRKKNILEKHFRKKNIQVFSFIENKYIINVRKNKGS